MLTNMPCPVCSLVNVVPRSLAAIVIPPLCRLVFDGDGGNVAEMGAFAVLHG
jgi:hypothetical protein